MAPRSVAVIGASADPSRIGGRPIDYMLRHGFAGQLFPVNPNRAEVQGLEAYAAIDALPVAPDVGVVAVPGELAVSAIDELGRRGTRSAIVFSSGFAENGEAGRLAQIRMLEVARRHGMRVLGPNCAGMFNARIGYYPIFASIFQQSAPPPGRIGIAGQSGAFCTHLYALARQRGIGISVCATTGNEMDVDVADVIRWLVEDPDTDVIAAYCEGFPDGPRLIASLEAARRSRKPVVMVKVGRSELGASAIQSHTAAIAGDDAATDAVLRDLGVVRAESIEQMLDIVYTATRRIFPVENKLGVISISGGVGILISDAAEAAGLAMPEMPAATQARLKERAPFASPRNPVDCTAQAINDPKIVGLFAEAMVEESYASILAFFSTGGGPVLSRAIREQLIDIRRRHLDRLFVVTQIGSAEEAAAYEAEGFAVFEDPTRAVVAIEAMGRFGRAFAQAPAPEPTSPSAAPLTLPSGPLNEAGSKQLLADAGIAIAPERTCRSVDEAVAAAESLGFPVVLKILSADIAHKSDIGGVVLGLASSAAVRSAYAQVNEAAERHAPHARLDGVLMARQLIGGVETIMGIARDPVFGPMAMFGLGGVFVEVLEDVVFCRCPFDEDRALALIRSIKGRPLLEGARGRPAADVASLARMWSRLSRFAVQAGPSLASIDLNPVLALPEGQGAFAVDAVVLFDHGPGGGAAGASHELTPVAGTIHG